MHRFNIFKNDPFFNNHPSIQELILHFNIPGRTDLSPLKVNVSIPNVCPFENKPSSFSFIMNTPHMTQVNGSIHFGIVFQCPSCHKYCVIDYEKTGSESSRLRPYNYNFFYPKLDFTEHEFNILSSISSQFKDIYIQAEEAEKLQLDLIYPMGYRKALEFLVDGYLIHIIGKKRHTVTQNRLQENIKGTKDPDLINTAKVAAWAGNDDTHLRTRNPKLNIINLKDSLLAFAHFVINKVISRKDACYVQKYK